MGGLRLRLLGDRPESEGMPLLFVNDLAVPAVTLLLKGSHESPSEGQRHRPSSPMRAEEMQRAAAQKRKKSGLRPNNWST